MTNTVSIGDTAVVEGNLTSLGAATKTSAKLRVTLAAPAAVDTDVYFETEDDTAVAPGDYQAKPAIKNYKIKIKAGKSMGTIGVTVYGNTATTSDRAFKVNLLSATGGTDVSSTRGTGTVTILEDDPAGAPTVAIGDSTVVEGNQTLTSTPAKQTVPLIVTLSEPATSEVTVSYQTGAGSATPDVDYVALPKPTVPPKPPKIVKIKVGKTTAMISPQVLGDTDPESTETFPVNIVGVSTLSGPVPTVARGTGTVTILDDDGSGSVAPSAPQNLTATDVGNHVDALIEWDAPADEGASPIIRYNIEVDINGGGFNPLVSVSEFQTSWFDHCGAANTCTYRVTAENSDDEGPFAETSVCIEDLSGTVCNPPT